MTTNTNNSKINYVFHDWALEEHSLFFDQLLTKELFAIGETDKDLHASVNNYVKSCLAITSNRPPEGPLPLKAILQQTTQSSLPIACSSSDPFPVPQAVSEKVSAIYTKLKTEWIKRRFDPKLLPPPSSAPFRHADFVRLQKIAAKEEALLQDDALRKVWPIMKDALPDDVLEIPEENAELETIRAFLESGHDALGQLTELLLNRLQLKCIPKEIKNLPRLERLNLSANQISQIENLPPALIHLVMMENQISQIENLPPTLIQLVIIGNQISQIENLPAELKILLISKNQIKQINNLPPQLLTLGLSGNQISRIENLPLGLRGLYLNDNKIKYIQNLPQTLQDLELKQNDITRVENLPLQLVSINLLGNPLAPGELKKISNIHS